MAIEQKDVLVFGGLAALLAGILSIYGGLAAGRALWEWTSCEPRAVRGPGYVVVTCPDSDVFEAGVINGEATIRCRRCRENEPRGDTRTEPPPEWEE